MTKSSFKQAHEFEKRRTESHSGFQPSVPLMISHTLSLISEQYEAARALCIESMAVMLRKSGDSAGAKASEQMEAITFADVAGVDEAKAELEEIVEFLRNPEKYIRLGARPPSAVLLVECIIPKDDGSRLEKYYLRYSRIMRWTGLYEAHLWDKSNWNHNQNKKGKQDKQKLWHSDQTGFHVAYFD